jgi:hypothetical protein
VLLLSLSTAVGYASFTLMGPWSSLALVSTWALEITRQ